MSYEKCVICKETLYEWRLPHKCKPTWECIIKDYHDEDEPEIFHTDGYDYTQVAEHFAAKHFQGEGSEWDVWVRKDSYDEWHKYTVEVEAVPSFTASLI